MAVLSLSAQPHPTNSPCLVAAVWELAGTPNMDFSRGSGTNRALLVQGFALGEEEHMKGTQGDKLRVELGQRGNSLPQSCNGCSMVKKSHPGAWQALHPIPTDRMTLVAITHPAELSHSSILPPACVIQRKRHGPEGWSG